MILAPAQHALTELILHSDVYVGASSRLSLAALHFPHLCALSLRRLVFEPSAGIEPFVLRHAATLTRLELLTCKLPTRAGTLLSPSPSQSITLARDEESSFGPACWERIWDRFMAELTALVALHIDEGLIGLECRYVNPGRGISYWEELDTPEPRNAADVAALRRFHMTVAARSRGRAGNPEEERRRLTS